MAGFIVGAHRFEHSVIDRFLETDLTERDVGDREFVFGRLGLESRVLAQQCQDWLAH